MRCRIIITILTLVHFVAFAQKASFKGSVIDSMTGEPVEGAAVCLSYNIISYTNNEGLFTFERLEKGQYGVKISHLGYKSFSDTLEIQDTVYKKIRLEPAPIEFDEVIVTTRRVDRFLRDSPYSELLYSRESIEKKPFASLPDALKTEPGISLVREGAWGTELNIRGLSRENVIALIDGNRIATSTDVAARFSMVDMNDIENVEIIKGASSSIYGSGATGGIVNIITRSSRFRDNFSLNGNVSAGYNTVNRSPVISTSLYGGGPVWSSKIAASYRKAGNIRTPAGELRNSQFEDYGLSADLSASPFTNHKMNLNYQLFKALNVGIPGSFVFPSNADIRYPDEKRSLFSAGYEIRNLTPFFYKLSMKYSYQTIARNVENIPHIVQYIPGTPTSLARRVSVLKITPEADHINNNLQLQGNFLMNGVNNLAAGLDYWDRNYNGFRKKYQRIELINDQNEVVNTIDKTIGEMPLPDSKYRDLGIFLQDDYVFIQNRLSLSLGTRLDLINIQSEKTPNPVYEIVNGTINYTPDGQQIIWGKKDINDRAYSANLGIKYSLNESLDLTLSLGYSFRSPSLEERFQYIDQGSYVRLGNPSLQSERGSSADLGIRYYQADFKVVSSFFFNYFTDLVSEKPAIFENRQALIKTNIGKARLYGFDLRTDYNIYQDFVLHGILSYVKGDDITAGGNLSEIPPLNGNFGIEYKLFRTLEAGLSAEIYAAQDDIAPFEISTPGYAVFSFSINTEPINISAYSLRIYSGLENIFDKNYRDHLSTLRGNITAAPGRNFYIKFTTEF